MLSTVPPPGGVLGELPNVLDHISRLHSRLPRPRRQTRLQSEIPDASPPTLLLERQRGAGDATGVSLPDPSGSRSVTTRLRSYREC